MDARELAAELSRAIGLLLVGEADPDPESPHAIVLSPDGLDPRRAFHVRISPRWHHIEAVLVTGLFAGSLVDDMVRRLHANPSFIESLRRSANESGWTLEVEAGRTDSVTGRPAGIQIRVVSPLSVLDPQTEMALVKQAGELVLSAGLAIMPVEEVDVPQFDEGIAGLPEGARVRVIANKYERNPINRAIAIRVHGSSCQVCGVNFRDTYGILGTGYIHVHHRVPVSKIGPDYIVDPAKDLVPVCPNCHAMLHVQDPPLEPEELHRILTEERKRKLGS